MEGVKTGVADLQTVLLRAPYQFVRSQNVKTFAINKIFCRISPKVTVASFRRNCRMSGVSANGTVRSI